MTMTELVAQWYAQDETQPPVKPDDLRIDVAEFIMRGDPGAADAPFPGGTWTEDDVYDAVWTYWDERDKRESGERTTATTAEILAGSRKYSDLHAKAHRAALGVSSDNLDYLSQLFQSAYLAGYQDRLSHERAELRAELSAMDAKRN